MLAAWYRPENHPQFADPPVAETAMALEFPPVPGMDLYRLMKLQEAWEQDYPNVSDVPGAPPTPVGDNSTQPMVFFGEPPKRVWAAAATSGLLIQTQADRLILNWRKLGSAGPYPGYSRSLRDEYFRLWEMFSSAVSGDDRDAPIPTLAEFTYVNIVPLEESEKPADVLNILSETPRPLPGSERQSRFEIWRNVTTSDADPYAAQVRVVGELQSISAGTRQLVFTVTAQVLLDVSQNDSGAAIDAAHGLASYTFSQIVTDEKQSVWKRLP